MAVKATPPLAGTFRLQAAQQFARGGARRPGVTPAAIRGAGAGADIPAFRRWPQRRRFTRRLGGAARQVSLRSTTERPGEEVAETLPDLRRHLDPIDLRRQLRRPLVGGEVGATRRAFAQVRL